MNISLYRQMQVKLVVAAAFIFSLFFCLNISKTEAAGVETKNSDYAVLIVGDESKAEMTRAEKELISEITKLLAEKNDKGAYKYARARSGMQVFSYHINHEREKQFCEKKLNILNEDLLFVGIIYLKDKLPNKVVYRVDRIVNEGRAAHDVFNYAEDLLANVNTPNNVVAASKSETTSAPSKPAAASSTQTTTTKTSTVSAPANSSTTTTSKAPAVSAPTQTKTTIKPSSEAPAATTSTIAASTKKYAPVPEGKYLSCQIGAFSNEANANELIRELQAKGYSAVCRKFERAGGSAFYRVYSGSFSARADAEVALQRLKESGFTKAILVTLDK